MFVEQSRPARAKIAVSMPKTAAPTTTATSPKEQRSGMIRGTRSAVAVSFLTSDEFRADLINGWYQQYLGRTADVSGANTWLAQMRQGTTQEQVQVALITSAESQREVSDQFLFGQPQVSFVYGLYATVLQRSPMLEEALPWVGVLDGF